MAAVVQLCVSFTEHSHVRIAYASIIQQLLIHLPRNMEPIAIIVFSLIFVFLLKLSGKSRKVKLVDKLPGPSGVPILGNSLQFIGVERCDRMQEIMKRDKLYGPIYRNWIGSIPYIHIANAEMAEVVLNLKNSKKGQIYSFLEPWLGRGMLISDGSQWMLSRKLITPTFHFQILDLFLETFSQSGQMLVHLFKRKADNGKPFDIYPMLTLAALDSICETAMGTKINAQLNEESEYVKSIYEILQLIFYRYDRVWLHNDFLWKHSAVGQKAQKKIDMLHGFTDKVIRERREKRKREKAENESCKSNEEGFEGKKRKAFLDLLLDECENQSTPFSDQQLRNEVNTFMFEGHDTTTASLCFTMFMLGCHPAIQEDVYQEQLSVLGSSKDIAPTMRDLTNMKLLDRVIKEILRLYPPVPFISRTLTEDAKIGDYLVPGGSVAFISLASILRDPKHFPDPDEFNPDRFLTENSIGRHPYANIPFSAGSRNCIGQRFAIIEAKTFLSYVVRNFKITTVTKPSEFKVVIEIVQKPAKDLQVLLTTRT